MAAASDETLGAAASGDAAFRADVTGRLAGLPGVLAVTLGGSRVAGTARQDSDWDFAVYYRGAGFDPDSLRALGWPGEIFPIGGWGGGVFNGGAWLLAGDRHLDVHYRDLDDVEHHLAEARLGRFWIERLLFHLAGIPSYIVVAELGVNQVLHGDLPRPPIRRRSAPARRAGGGAMRRRHSATPGLRTPATGTWPIPPGRSQRPPARPRMRCWLPAGSGSPTRRAC